MATLQRQHKLQSISKKLDGEEKKKGTMDALYVELPYQDWKGNSEEQKEKKGLESIKAVEKSFEEEKV